MATPFQPSILSRLALRNAETHLRTHLAVRATKRLLACNPEGVNVRDLFEHAKGITMRIPKLGIDPTSGRVVQLGLVKPPKGKPQEVPLPSKNGEFSLSAARPQLRLSWPAQPKPQYTSVYADSTISTRRTEKVVPAPVTAGIPVVAEKEEPLFPTMTFLRGHVLPTMKQRHDVRSVKLPKGSTGKSSPYVWRLIERPPGTPKPGSPEAKAIEKNGSEKQKAKVAWNAEVAVLTSLRHLNRRRLNKRVQEMEKAGEKARY